MNRKLLALVGVALLAGALLLWAALSGRPAPPPPAQFAPQQPVDLSQRRGALVDEIVFTQESDVGKIVELIEAGTYHVFAQGLTNAAIFRRIRDSERVAHDISYGSTAELSINPAGPRFKNGVINPFHVPRIREALNRLVDRRHIAQELYGGLAVPRYLPLNTAFPDYARLADVARALEVRYRHDPEGARATIAEEMRKLGATLQGGRWFHDGAPLRIVVLIRTEDERRRVGDYISNLLEDTGFVVERAYRKAEEASRIWIAGDPNLGAWHIYTGSWVSTMINRDLAGNFSYYYTPRGRPEPLWQVYTPVPEFDQIAERLQRRDYRSWEERQQMMARALELSMRDSVRIWLVDQLNVWPRAQNVLLAVDLAGGVSGSALWPYTIRFRDRIGGRLVFATPSLLTEPWNPIAGSNWLFDTMIMRSLQDNELLPDPYTGLYLPQRIAGAEVTVQQGVPVIQSLDWLTVQTAERIDVPADAWIGWDAAAARFLTVGELHPQGLQARTRTRVRYDGDYLQRRWHDGTRLSIADLVLPWILTFERADKASRLYDHSYVPTFEVFRRHFRGWQIVSRDPLMIDIYSDQIYPDAEWIVATRAPNPSAWHTLALGISAERSGELAFSSAKADRAKVTWMSFVAGPSLPILERHLATVGEQGFVPYPNVLGPLMREGEVRERYDALARWFRERRHFWVGNGPFVLHSVHPVERSVVVQRFAEFPDAADKWLGFTRPPVPIVDVGGPLVIEGAQPARFTVTITDRGREYPGEDIEMVQFLLFDGSGRLSLKGDAEPSGGGFWRIALSGEQVAALGVGANTLEVAVSSRRVALPAFASHAFATVPQ
ncbi:MAG TPA: ABC transporter substrate-binding protein [Burkholderiaceae bacterium]|nr:ABC transporter substrate-binding protein [Burkholderiaceae bacterium]